MVLPLTALSVGAAGVERVIVLTVAVAESEVTAIIKEKWCKFQLEEYTWNANSKLLTADRIAPRNKIRRTPKRSVKTPPINAPWPPPTMPNFKVFTAPTSF